MSDPKMKAWNDLAIFLDDSHGPGEKVAAFFSGLNAGLAALPVLIKSLGLSLPPHLQIVLSILPYLAARMKEELDEFIAAMTANPKWIQIIVANISAMRDIFADRKLTRQELPDLLLAVSEILRVVGDYVSKIEKNALVAGLYFATADTLKAISKSMKKSGTL